MRALLLLLILCCCDGGRVAAGNDFDWSECGDTAFCQVLPSCNDPDNRGEYKMQAFFMAKKMKRCSIGVHIKPESTALWTVSILNKNQKASEEFSWEIGGNKIVNCADNKAVAGVDLPPTLHVDNIGQSFTDLRCTFKISVVNSQTETVSKLLNDLHGSPPESYLTFTPTLIYFGATNFADVDTRLRCQAGDLFLDSDSGCDISEQCAKTVDTMMWDCPAGFPQLYRAEASDNFTKVEKIKCVAGKFNVQFVPKGPLEPVGASAEAKCSRKKCSLCQPKTNFTSLWHAGNETHCASLTCTDKQFMVLNTTKGDHRGIPADEAVQCSTVTGTIPEKDAVPAEQARWHVQNDKEAEIEWAVCKDSVPCDVKIQTTCAKDEPNCKKAELKADGAYVCNEGTMHVEMNGTSEHIDTPKCEDNGKWNLTIYGADNVTSSRLWVDSDGELKIKCLLAAVAPRSDTPATASSWYIIAIVIVLVLIVIGVVIGVLFILKRQKNKQKPVSKASKSSSTATKSSSKPESSAAEKEPLTSAMKSLTGDSLHTAIPEGPKQTPAVVLTGADLRPVTAAAQPSTKRDKKSSTSGRNKDSEKKKRDAKQPQSEDTSKNQDGPDPLEKLVPMPGSDEDRESLLKSQTGGDGESQVESQKRKKAAAAASNGNPDSAKPQGRRKYRQSGSTPGPKKKDDNFLHLTDSDDNKDDEPSQTGSKKRRM